MITEVVDNVELRFVCSSITRSLSSLLSDGCGGGGNGEPLRHAVITAGGLELKH